MTQTFGSCRSHKLHLYKGRRRSSVILDMQEQEFTQIIPALESHLEILGARELLSKKSPMLTILLKRR